LILTPRWADRTPHFANPACQDTCGDPELSGGALVYFALLHCCNAQLPFPAGVLQRVAKQLALCRVDQRMRPQNRRESRQRTAGREQNARAFHFITALPEPVQRRTERALRQQPGPLDAAVNERFCVAQIHRLSGVIGLSRSRYRAISELDPAPLDNDGLP